jgi:tRNA (cmo5U34)-methyltransferase
MGRDQIYLEPRAQVEPFQFDAHVARVFDDMIRRSIPGYATLLELTALAAQRYVQDGSAVYDLGCSLGTTSVAMGRVLGGRGVSLHAIDQSSAMVERCARLLAEQLPNVNVCVQVADVREVQFLPTSFVVVAFTLQFIPPQERLDLLQRVYDALLPGGALIVSEKLKLDEAEAAVLEPLHDAFRLANGYSDLELAQKRQALENILRCDSEAQHRQRLCQVGFGQVVGWFRAANFGSWLALK